MRTVVGFDRDSDIKYTEQTPGGTLLKLANIDANEALELYLDRFAAKEVAGLLAERHGWTVVEASDYWLDCVAALEEERSKWGRAELLLERACEELVGRGASTAAEECAAAAINGTLRLVAEELHRIHREEVEARQEDR